MLETIHVQTPSRSAFIEITDRIESILEGKDLRQGVMVAYVPHTTAGITINENADPDVKADMLSDLERLVPRNQSSYRHYEGNSDSHFKASLMGSHVVVPMEENRLVLGTWQGIFLCEFDGPRNRRVIIKLLPEGE